MVWIITVCFVVLTLNAGVVWVAIGVNRDLHERQNRVVWDRIARVETDHKTIRGIAHDVERWREEAQEFIRDRTTHAAQIQKAHGQWVAHHNAFLRLIEAMRLLHAEYRVMGCADARDYGEGHV